MEHKTPLNAQILLSDKQAADLLGCKPRTLQNWRVVGGGPPFLRLTPRMIRYRQEDILTWAAQYRALNTSSYPDKK